MLENDISAKARVFEFKHPATQSKYDLGSNQMILTQCSALDRGKEREIRLNMKISEKTPVINPESISDEEKMPDLKIQNKALNQALKQGKLNFQKVT